MTPDYTVIAELTLIDAECDNDGRPITADQLATALRAAYDRGREDAAVVCVRLSEIEDAKIAAYLARPLGGSDYESEIHEHGQRSAAFTEAAAAIREGLQNVGDARDLPTQRNGEIRGEG